ncbi:acetylxylan esterase [Chondrinema litorale]|uniref:glucuronyl esterase domain-containing protein n=1 Tax=Chondrinema litorale TaxID=2994555 RepID=UPI002542FBF7|nr:acetylxylan esterase [Chondrinema litorale]UZR97239.1 acetylxylan esterase [Chondrinema litorale]
MKINLLLILICILSFVKIQAQQFTPNYDESKIPEYKLMPILTNLNGEPVSSVKQWEKKRRPEILKMFQEEMYGIIPKGKLKTSYHVLESSNDALNSKAIRRQVRITFEKGEKSLSMDLLIYLPKGEPEAVPVFLTTNFYGNHSIQADENILLSNKWMMANEKFGIEDHQATEASRGVRENRWPVDIIIQSGYGLVTFYYGDIDPDYNNFKDGIHPFFYSEEQEKPDSNEWGSVAAWAWGLSRAMDYLETSKEIDSKKVAVFGHSRLGKASLCAGAYDERFAIVISNDSGCGGAALSKRAVGETVGKINESFPHWFCGNFKKYNENETALPFDQHMFLALMAPRPVYVASAVEDQWADPIGEFLSLKEASAVYELYGLPNIGKEEMPKVDQSLQTLYTGYHIRTGGHDVKDYDWQQYISFADKYFKNDN